MTAARDLKLEVDLIETLLFIQPLVVLALDQAMTVVEESEQFLIVVLTKESVMYLTWVLVLIAIEDSLLQDVEHILIRIQSLFETIFDNLFHGIPIMLKPYHLIDA